MQRSAFIQLTVAAVLFFVLIMGAAYVFLVPLGQRNVRGVAPVLGEFMQAGRDLDVVTGHSLLSRRGLATYSREDLAEYYAMRNLFEGYDRLKVTSFEVKPNNDPFVPETAKAAAIVHYDEGPAARLDVELDFEETAWRIRSFGIARQESVP
jgi:hypothetical protein